MNATLHNMPMDAENPFSVPKATLTEALTTDNTLTEARYNHQRLPPTRAETRELSVGMMQ